MWWCKAWRALTTTAGSGDDSIRITVRGSLVEMSTGWNDWSIDKNDAQLLASTELAQCAETLSTVARTSSSGAFSCSFFCFFGGIAKIQAEGVQYLEALQT